MLRLTCLVLLCGCADPESSPRRAPECAADTDCAGGTCMLLGATYRHAVIWRSACNAGELWFGDFAAGYSCGACVDTGGTFDEFTPVSCSTVELELESAGAVWCNWT